MEAAPAEAYQTVVTESFCHMSKEFLTLSISIFQKYQNIKAISILGTQLLVGSSAGITLHMSNGKQFVFVLRTSHDTRSLTPGEGKGRG